MQVVDVPKIGRKYALAPVALALCILVVNAMTADRSPRPWLDEAMFADPGLNLIDGRGFVSGWWPSQPSDEFFAGNAPLYSLLVGGWAFLFGSELTTLRLLNPLLLALAAGFLILGLRRRKLVQDWRSDLLLVFLLYGGYAMTFSYRSVRYDVLGIVLCAALFAATSIPRRELAWLSLFGVAALLPIAGLHLLPYVALVCVLRFLFDANWRVVLQDGIAIAAGIVLGALIFLLTLAHAGVVDRLITSATQLSIHGEQSVNPLSVFWSAIRTDPSSLLLLGSLLLVAVLPVGRRVLGSRMVLVVFAFGVVVPGAIALAGKFPIYYGWMRFVPLVLVTVILTDRLIRASHYRAVVGILLICLVAGYGLPGRLYVATTNWSANDPAHLHAAVQQWLAEDDVVYATPLAYFAVRNVTPRIYGDPYFWREQEWNENLEVNVLVVAPAEAARAIARVGGEWEMTGRFDPPGVTAPREDTGIGHTYHSVVIYRRTGAGTYGDR
jgi:hypothetical protein